MRHALIACSLVLVACTSFGTTASDSGTVNPPVDLTDGGVVDAAPKDAAAVDASQGCAGTILCDDFEDRGSASDVAGTKWVSKPGLGTSAIANAQAHTGSRSLALSLPVGTNSYAVGLEAAPVVTADHVRVRAAVMVSAKIAYAQLFWFTVDSNFCAVVIDNGELVAQYQNGGANQYKKTGRQQPLNQWMELAFEVRFGSKGGVRLLLDQAAIFAENAAITNGNVIDTFRLALTPNFTNVPTQQALTLHFDDVAVE